MRITVESKEKTSELSFPKLYRFLGITDNKGMVPSCIEDSIIVLFTSETNGIVVQVGKADTLQLGETGRFIHCTHKDWEICGSEIVVSFSN